MALEREEMLVLVLGLGLSQLQPQHPPAPLFPRGSPLESLACPPSSAAGQKRMLWMKPWRGQEAQEVKQLEGPAPPQVLQLRLQVREEDRDRDGGRPQPPSLLLPPLTEGAGVVVEEEVVLPLTRCGQRRRETSRGAQPS